MKSVTNCLPEESELWCNCCVDNWDGFIWHACTAQIKNDIIFEEHDYFMLLLFVICC